MTLGMEVAMDGGTVATLGDGRVSCRKHDDHAGGAIPILGTLACKLGTCSDLLSTASPSDLCRIAIAFATKARISDAKLFARIGLVASQRLVLFKAAEVVLLLKAFAALRFRQEALLLQAASSDFNGSYKLVGREIADLAFIYARFGIVLPSVESLLQKRWREVLDLDEAGELTPEAEREWGLLTAAGSSAASSSFGSSRALAASTPSAVAASSSAASPSVEEHFIESCMAAGCDRNLMRRVGFAVSVHELSGGMMSQKEMCWQKEMYHHLFVVSGFHTDFARNFVEKLSASLRWRFLHAVADAVPTLLQRGDFLREVLYMSMQPASTCDNTHAGLQAHGRHQQDNISAGKASATSSPTNVTNLERSVMNAAAASRIVTDILKHVENENLLPWVLLTGAHVVEVLGSGIREVHKRRLSAQGKHADGSSELQRQSKKSLVDDTRELMQTVLEELRMKAGDDTGHFVENIADLAKIARAARFLFMKKEFPRADSRTPAGSEVDRNGGGTGCHDEQGAKHVREPATCQRSGCGVNAVAELVVQGAQYHFERLGLGDPVVDGETEVKPEVYGGNWKYLESLVLSLRIMGLVPALGEVLRANRAGAAKADELLQADDGQSKTVTCGVERIVRVLPWLVSVEFFLPTEVVDSHTALRLDFI